MTTQRIEIRTPTVVLPTLQLRRMSAVLVLQLSARDPGARRSRGLRAAGPARERALAAAAERFEQDRAATQRTALRAL